MQADKNKLQYMIFRAMEDNPSLTQQFDKYSKEYTQTARFPARACKKAPLQKPASCYHTIISKQQSYIIIKAYIIQTQKLLTTQIIPSQIIAICLQYYHFVEAQLAAITERHFYKKYWIEAGKIGGTFSRIRKITRKSDKELFAVKLIKKKPGSKQVCCADINPSSSEQLRHEAFILQNCIHPNIIRLIDWCDTKKRIYMVTEYSRRHSADIIDTIIQCKNVFIEQKAINIVKQMVSAVECIHRLGYVHRDLTLSKFMYFGPCIFGKETDNVLKLADLSSVYDCYMGECDKPYGTSHFVAPEVVSGKAYNKSVDMWSLGVIIYLLLCGMPPFFDPGNEEKQLFYLINKGNYSFPSPLCDIISENAKDLVMKLLVKDVNKRLNVRDVLQHPWIAKRGNGTDRNFGEQYFKQISHWQSIRQQTEFVIKCQHQLQ